MAGRMPAINVALKKRGSAPGVDVVGCLFIVGFGLGRAEVVRTSCVRTILLVKQENTN